MYLQLEVFWWIVWVIHWKLASSSGATFSRGSKVRNNLPLECPGIPYPKQDSRAFQIEKSSALTGRNHESTEVIKTYLLSTGCVEYQAQSNSVKSILISYTRLPVYTLTPTPPLLENRNFL